MAILSNINGKFAVESTGAIQLSGSAGTANYVLVSGGAGGAASWVAASTVIGGPYLPLSGGTLTGNLSLTGAGNPSLTVTTGATVLGGTLDVSGIITAPGGTSTEWNTAYDNSIVSLAVTGTTTKTLTATQQDAGTLTASWTDNDSGGTVTGTGTANTVTKFTAASVIGDGPITFATNDSTFAGDVLIPSGYIKLGGYSFIGEDLTDTDSLTIASHISESIFFAHENAGVYTTTMTIDPSGNLTVGNPSYGSSLGQVRIINDAASNPASLSLFGYNNVADGGNYASIDLAMQTSGTGGNVVASIRGLAEGIGENASDLAFYTATGGTLGEKMRIQSNGSVGIGIDTATASNVKLRVVGDSNSEWTAEVKSTNTAGNSYGLVVNTLSGAGTYNLGCYTHTGNGFFVQNDGKVAIGVGAATLGRLHLTQSYTASLQTAYFQSSAYSAPHVTYDTLTINQQDVPSLVLVETPAAATSTHQKLSITVGDNNCVFRTSQVSGGMWFNVNGNVSSPGYQTTIGTNAIRILDNADVGIGESTPTEKLSVKGADQSIEEILRVRTANAAYPNAGASLGVSGYEGEMNVYDSANVKRIYLSSHYDCYINPKGPGFVGIGTTSPAATLDVDDGNAGKIRLLKDGSVRAEFSNNANEGELSLYRSSTVKNIYISSYYNSYFNGGNVGIGQTSPGAKLEIGKAQSDTMTYATAFLALRGNPGGDGILMGQRASTPYAGWIQAGYTNNIGTSHHYPLALQPHGANVGIGTTSPSNLLHLKSTISGPTGIIIENTNNAQSLDIDFWNNAGAAQGRIRYNEGAGSFDFSPNVGVGPAMTMLYGGNVGIGTTSPATLLSNTATIIGNADGLTVNLSGTNWEVNGQGYVGAFSNLATGAGQHNAGVLIEIAGDDATDKILDLESGGSNKLRVYGTGNVNFNGDQFNFSGSTIAGTELYLYGGHDASAPGGRITSTTTGVGANSTEINMNGGGIDFDPGTGSSAMVIDSNGEVGINNTSPSATLHLTALSSTGVPFKLQGHASTSVEQMLMYTTQTAGTGWYWLVAQANSVNQLIIYGTGSIENTLNSYTGISDRKLKENIIDTAPKLEDIKKLRVINYNLIGDDKKLLGMVAQEVEEVFPGLVENNLHPSVNGAPREKIKSLKYSVLVPMLVKSIQELEARVKELENK